ncbi:MULTISPECIES: hypothetical protein [unclassified Thioalkalivibrio]|uniref:major capsid protein n=1 Tax=unclassified Thioalkalivibrio TaxID=2621013 RepID=UPI000381AE74|nr:MULTISPECIES: hypothetical protein [unclassified Thioalkalivibrio]
MNTKYAPFPIQEHLTQIALAYTNRAMIADDVLPRVSVGKQVFKWMEYAKSERFTVPNTLVGRKSMPNEVEFGAKEETAATRDYGLDDIIPNADLENADERHDPVGHAVEAMTDLILLDREVRVAGMVHNPDNFTHKEALAAGSKWSNPDANPIPAVLEYLDTPIVRPNIAVMGNAAWTALRTNPHIVKAAHGNSGDSGAATRAAVAELFELEDILVGQGFVNTARKGQEPNMARVWGAHCAFLHRNPVADTQRGLTFGYTAQWGDRVAGQMNEEKVGLRGSQRVRVGESLVELIAAKDAGFFVQNVKA